MSAQPPSASGNVSASTAEISADQGLSPRFSFKGWSFPTWLVKNAAFVKTTLTGASTATGAVAVIDAASLRTVLIVWGVAAAAIGVRAGLDAVHYFLAEVRNGDDGGPRA